MTFRVIQSNPDSDSLYISILRKLHKKTTKKTLRHKRVYESRYLSLNMIPNKQFVLYTDNASREEIIPKERGFFNRRVHHD